MKHFFVINPYAGKGNRVQNLMDLIRTVCERRNEEYTIHQTAGIGEAEQYIRSVCLSHGEGGEVFRFYACGGDGTINECVNGAVGFSFAEVAIVPIGTGNDFVRNFHGENSAAYVESLLDANAIPIDLIKYNDRYCVNMINIGYDCAVVVRTAKIKAKPWIPSKLAYIFGLIGELVKKTGVTFRCEVDGQDMGERRLLLSLFANGCYCGGGFRSAPLADLRDGLMDLCFIRYISRLRFITLVGKYKKGTHLAIKNRERTFDYFKCREVKLTFSAPQQICVDGELETCDSLCMSMERDAVRIVMPGKEAISEEVGAAANMV